MKTTALAMVLAMGSAFPAVAQGDHEHGDDGIIGVSGAGQLGIEIDTDETFLFEELFTDGGFNGWISDAPGFTTLDEDEPDEDFFMIDPAAVIAWQLVGTSNSAMQVYNPFFDVPGLGAGDQFTLGSLGFDTHPFWFLDLDDAGYNPADSEWDVSFRLVDLGSTGYTDSEVVTLTFAIPAPATAGAFALLGVCSTRRRR